MNDHVVRQDRWSPMPRLQDEINRLFGVANTTESSSATAGWVPAVDIHEYADRFEFYVDLPGVEPGKVELTLENGVLTLSGERATAPSSAARNSSEQPQFERMERGRGHFYRRFVLPQTVDSEKVNAAGKDGVLTVTVPKQARAMPRRITIAV